MAWPAAIAAIAGAAASVMGNEAANRANARQAQRQMNFQQFMSNTAHQREVSDLRAAGLNPILSATKGGGASTPGGAAAQINNAMEGIATTALDYQRMKNDAELQRQQISSMKKQEKLTDAQIDKTRTETQVLGKDAEKSKLMLEAIERGKNLLKTGADKFKKTDTYKYWNNQLNDKQERLP